MSYWSKIGIIIIVFIVNIVTKICHHFDTWIVTLRNREITIQLNDVWNSGCT